MRSLKFRAWKMIGGKLRRCVCSPFGLLDYAQRHPEAPVLHNEDVNDIRDFMPNADVIEQYTGLKDKNGKEIYEGDIIQEEIDFNSKMTDGTFRYRVYWDEEELCWCLEHIGNESIRHELWQFDESTEVIGNIHENPELLEQDDAKD